MPKEKGSIRVEAPGRPPKAWFDKMEKDVKKKNPDYSDEQVRKTVGNIWYNKLSQYRRDKLTKKHESSLRVDAAYSHSFSPEFYGDIYSWTSEGPRPTNVADAISAWWETDKKSFVEMVKELFPHWAEYAEEYLSESLVSEIMDKILETDTVGTLKPPVDVWIDPDGYFTIDVWDEQDDKDKRVEATQKRIYGERIAAIAKRIFGERIEAAQFPNLFSSDTRKWIELQTRNLAANMGPISSPEQAVAFVNDAAKQVISQISEAVNDEVQKIIEAEKDNILKEIVTEDTTFEEEVMAPPPAPQIPMEMAEAPEAPASEDIAPPPMAASKKALKPHKLKLAFEKSANPAEQSLALVKLDPTFLAHLDELEEQAESVERLAEWVKDYIVGRGLIDAEVAESADWLEPTKLLTTGRKKKAVEYVTDYPEPVINSKERVRAEFSKMRSDESIDAWGMARMTGVEPLTAERELNQLVQEGLALKEGNWYSLEEGDWRS
jgi:hypothetical protein